MRRRQDDPEQDAPSSAEDVVSLPITGELDLHAFQPRDVLSVVEEYLLCAQRKGLRTVRVVHGKGKGVQRAAVRSLLARLPCVESFGDAQLGAWGATLVVLRGAEEGTQL